MNYLKCYEFAKWYAEHNPREEARKIISQEVGTALTAHLIWLDIRYCKEMHDLSPNMKEIMNDLFYMHDAGASYWFSQFISQFPFDVNFNV